MSNKSDGKEITQVFKYVQQVFRECQQLIFKVDNLMKPEWNVVYGSRITRDVTSSIYEPNRWLVQAIFRVYEGEDKSVNKAIAITFWGNEEQGIEEPIITAGKLVYSDINKRGHWDLWDIWYDWVDDNEKNEYEIDGTINNFTSKECDYISEAKVFSYPLVSISDDKELEDKIVSVLRDL